MDNSAILREWFERVDSNRTGSITAPQLKAALAVGNLEFSLSVVQQMIRMYDFDRNGTMSFDGERLMNTVDILVILHPDVRIEMRLSIHAKQTAEFVALNKFLIKIQQAFSDLERSFNYVLDCGEVKQGLKHAAKVKDPSSSRVLNLWTNAPGMLFYTGNYVDGVVGKAEAVYGKHSGLCLETQGFPNAINQPNFPSVVKPGEKYKHTMLFEFSVE